MARVGGRTAEILSCADFLRAARVLDLVLKKVFSFLLFTCFTPVDLLRNYMIYKGFI